MRKIIVPDPHGPTIILISRPNRLFRVRPSYGPVLTGHPPAETRTAKQRFKVGDLVTRKGVRRSQTLEVIWVGDPGWRQELVLRHPRGHDSWRNANEFRPARFHERRAWRKQTATTENI